MQPGEDRILLNYNPALGRASKRLSKMPVLSKDSPEGFPKLRPSTKINLLGEVGVGVAAGGVDLLETRSIALGLDRFFWENRRAAGTEGNEMAKRPSFWGGFWKFRSMKEKPFSKELPKRGTPE